MISAMFVSELPYWSISCESFCTASRALRLTAITNWFIVVSVIPCAIQGSAVMAALLLKAVTDIVIATPYSLMQTASSIPVPFSSWAEAMNGVPRYLKVVPGRSKKLERSLSTGICRS